MEVGAEGVVLVDGCELPAELMLKTSPDGTVSLVSNPLGGLLAAGAVHTADGRLALPDSCQVQNNMDGSVSLDGVQLPDGFTVERRPDGAVVVTAGPDVARNVNNPDSLSRLETEGLPAGLAALATTHNDGAITLAGDINLPSGSRVNQDGSISLQKSTKITRNSDGSVSVDGQPLPPGLALHTGPGGVLELRLSAQLPLGSTANQDGSISLPAGAAVTSGPDGALRVDGEAVPAGLTVVTAVDGSVQLVSLAAFPPGRSAALPTGAAVERAADGSLTVDGVPLPAGVMVERKADGTVMLVNQPPGLSTAVFTSQDGTITIGDTNLPRGSTNQDGYILLPKTVKITENKDGSLLIDGKKLPPGFVLRNNPDGTSSLFPTSVGKPMLLKTNQDGSISIGNLKLPKGSQRKVDGSLLLPKLARIIENPDGSFTIDGKEMPPELKLRKNTDGTVSLVTISPGPPFAVQTNPNGTLSVGNFSLPSEASENEDGSISLPNSVKVKENPDGTFAVDGKPLPEGLAVRRHPDGTTSLVSLPSFNRPHMPVQIDPNGTLSIGNVSLPLGASEHGDGSISLPKSAKLTETSEGTFVDGKLLPTGWVLKKNRDGTTSLVFTSTSNQGLGGPIIDGFLAIGNIDLPSGAERNADGTVFVPSNARITETPDGRLLVDGAQLPVGVTAQRNADGSFILVPSSSLQPSVRTSSDGAIFVGDTKLPSGAVQTRDGNISLPQNTRITENQDGSLTVDGRKLPTGIRIHRNTDGTIILLTSIDRVQTTNGEICLANRVKLSQTTDGSVLMDSDVINRPDGSRSFLSATAVTFPGATQRTQSGVAAPARPLRPYSRSRPGSALS